MLETFVVFLGHIVYNTFFIILLICSLKFNFESIVIPSNVRDETNFVVISLICNVCESVFPRLKIESYQDLLSLNCIQTIHIRFMYFV